MFDQSKKFINMKRLQKVRGVSPKEGKWPQITKTKIERRRKTQLGSNPANNKI